MVLRRARIIKEAQAWGNQISPTIELLSYLFLIPASVEAALLREGKPAHSYSEIWQAGTNSMSFGDILTAVRLRNRNSTAS